MMSSRLRYLLASCLMAVGAAPMTANADQEASNVAHVAAGPYGRCYAKSVPEHVYDPETGPRQQGVTKVFEVNADGDALVQEYDWFSQRLFVLCSPVDGPTLVRIGPWHRGHDPSADHLAIAFYRGGEILGAYSTLDIAGNEPSDSVSFSSHKNVSASVSHYTVFETPPELVKIVASDGPVFTETWEVHATTIDGRRLRFDLSTGALQ